MKFILSFLFTFLLIFPLLAQIVTTDPAIPLDSRQVTIFFDATQGTQGLMGFTGDVYAHTGVITDKSQSGSDWKYVKTNWGQNTPATKLTRIDTDLYSLVIGPTIRQYYGVPSNEDILKMAFVFRSADSSKEGKGDGGTDIFVEVFTEGFIIQIDQPQDNSILEPGEIRSIQVSCTESATIELIINDVLVNSVTGTSLLYEHSFTDAGDFWIIALADNGMEMISDTVFVCVREEVRQELLPEGLRKGINYTSESEATLVLWAPYKQNVFVLGDFTDWRPRNAYQMKKDGDFYWLEIEGLTPGQPYVFQYLIDGSLLIPDPYTDQVSDPNNDKNIPASVYPDLVAYPQQKTSGLAAVLTTGQEDYDWEIEEFIPAPEEKLVIYELLIRDFDNRQSYAAVTERLDYLQDLGINALELMPVNEFEGNLSWGYNPSFYFAPDKFYGPKNELKRLIDECHKRGMAVIIDMVLNHSYGQSPFAQMYLDGGKPSVTNPWYNRESNFTNPDAQWGYDFNHESPHTQELVDSINSYWMTEYKVDGFRFDFTKGFGNNIKTSSDPWGSVYDADRIRLLKRMADEIWERNPDALVIFEHLSDNTEEKELANYGILLWGNMNHNYAEAAMGYNTGSNSNLTWGLYKARGWNEPNLVTYMESHDEERIMYKIAQWGSASGDYNTKDPVHGAHRIGLNAVFFLPLPGPKMIWQFGELGYDISIDYDCRVCEKPVLWNYFEEWQRKNIYDVMSNLNYLKAEYPIFSTEDMTYNLTGEIKRYQLETDGEYVVAIGNFAVSEKNTTLTFPVTGSWYDYFKKESVDITQPTQAFALAPGEYKLFSTQELDWKTDMSPVNTEEFGGTKNFQKFGVFPNPTENSIQWEIGLVKHQVFDGLGNLVLETRPKGNSKMDISWLPAGNYISLAIDENGNYWYAKWIKN